MSERVPLRLWAACFVMMVSCLWPAAATAQTGRILGQLFTAEHPDSVAVGAELTLIFRGADGEVERIPATAGPDGEYEFSGLSTDPEIQYVVKVSHFGRDFLGAPIQFEQGETELAYNFLVSRDAAPLPADGMEGHPPMSQGAPAQMSPPPVYQDPVTMVVIVLTLFALFGLPIANAYRKDGLAPASGGTDPEAAALIRDIASLDVRFERRELEEPDYQSVRRSLLRRLNQITGVSAETPR